MPLARVRGQSFGAPVDHADGWRGRSCVRGPPPLPSPSVARRGHGCGEQLMEGGLTMKRLTWLLALLVLFGMAPQAWARGDEEEGRCTTASLAGRWGFSASGVFVTGPFPGPAAAAGVFTVEPDGAFSGGDTGSFNGTIVSETFTGTLTVNPDCTGSAVIMNNLGLEAHFHFVVVDKRKELRAIQTQLSFGTSVVSLSARKQ